MKRLRRRERKRFVRMRMKNRTSERVAIGKEKSRHWESKNNLNVWKRTIQDKSKKVLDICDSMLGTYVNILCNWLIL